VNISGNFRKNRNGTNGYSWPWGKLKREFNLVDCQDLVTMEQYLVDCQDLVKREFHLVDCQDLVKRDR
jgi:hypothetical protein